MRSNRIWWVVGLALVAGIFALLAAVAGRQAPVGQGGELAPGESEILRGQVVEVLEEGTIEQGEFSQTYQRLRVRVTRGHSKARRSRWSRGCWA